MWHMSFKPKLGLLVFKFHEIFTWMVNAHTGKALYRPFIKQIQHKQAHHSVRLQQPALAKLGSELFERMSKFHGLTVIQYSPDIEWKGNSDALTDVCMYVYTKFI
jgi:hypothetical protein